MLRSIRYDLRRGAVGEKTVLGRGNDACWCRIARISCRAAVVIVVVVIAGIIVIVVVIIVV
ncbi:MAG: hypothetical protein V4804_08610, partial [Pseudomonadota bacterium]